MGKLIVTLICAFTIMGFVYAFVGPKLMTNVYSSSHISISWFLLVGGCVTYGIWRIVKGK